MRSARSRRVGTAIAEGYVRDLVGLPDEWGALDRLGDWATAAALQDLERQEAGARLDPL